MQQKLMNNHSLQVEPVKPTQTMASHRISNPTQAIPGRIEPDPLVLLYGIGRHPIKRHSPAIKSRVRSGESGQASCAGPSATFRRIFCN